MGKLLRLELFNFKSYKGHHIVLFGDAYFTSIIGPNGSGKSNSMDAISFVLGIRSSHLRSSHLRDLTYRGRVLKTSQINDDGSAELPPQAPAAKVDDIVSDGESGSQSSARNIPKSAWVMAVYLDDAEDEQKWKRTITIQGASEYRINDRVVTAGQYNAALESENILINARNFLVFQGDVEKIASQSPKELTRLIEQISGSLEYKAEYERLEDEAKQTADNQQHRLEIRRSINSELKQFREQKKEADAYLAKANELDQATVTYNLWELYHLKLEIDEVVRSIKDHQENLKEYRRGVEKYEKTLEDARQAQSKVAKDVSRAERTIKQKEKEIGNKENSVVPIDQKIEITADAIRKSSNKIDSLAREQENHNNEIRKLEKDLAIIEKAGQDFERKRQETLSNQGKKLSETDYKEYNTLKAQVVAKTGENQVTLNHLIRQVKNDQITVDSLQRKVGVLQTSIDKLQIEINDLSKRKEATLASVTQITQDIDSKKKELTHVISERIRLNQKHTELEEKLRRVLNEIADADDGRRRNQKEQSMKDTIAALKRIYRGVRGRVGDLCKPKQKKYDEAIITALGRDFDSVVVDTEKTAIECVQYLKDRRSSPMTFVPLDKIKVSGPDANLKGLPKARLTIDTIEFDSSLERAMAYACGDSIVCDDLDTAKHICFDRHIKVKAVTLQGEVIHKAGLMTGGRGPDQGNKRKFDDQDVEKLRAQVTRFQNEIETLPERHRRGAAEEILQNDLLRLERKFSDANSELTAFDQNLTSKKKELAYEQRQLQELQPGLIDKENALHQIQDNVAKLQKIVDGAQDDIFADFCNRLGYSDIRAYEAQQGSLEQQYDEERSKYKKQKAKLTAQIKWDTEQRDDITNRIRSMERTVESLKAEIMEYENERAALEEAIDSDNAKVTELNDELRRHKEKLAQRIEKVNQARNELHKQSKNLEEHSKEIAALEIQAQQLASKRYAVLSRCKMEQIAIPLRPNSRKLESLPLEKEITLQPDPDEMEIDEEDNHPEDLIKDDGINVNTDSLDQDFLSPGNDVVGEGLKQRIIDLKVELEKLNPNMRATDRLKGTEDRLKIIEKDFEDARKDATRAKDAFDDVKSIRNDLFHKAFGHISEGIQNVYKELTRSSAFPLGGSAYLDIEDSDEPYLSGIKYHAMPPLKRFRDMEHLSGGEKTMAALALLFAVHSFKPSPFFVLDEVDAALDNANVESIKNYIQGHAGPGMQFIVISLKTGLFQGSESLVGVFRDQEANSSKTLTIDLRKYRAA